MLQSIYSFFGTILNFFSNLTGGSYLLGLLIFAFLIKVVLLPFGIKQQKNSIRQAMMRPKEEAIRKKYKGRNDQVTQQKMQNELMEMYQAEGYSPASGCLPMILQMVIILLLYQVIIFPLQHVVGIDVTAVSALKSFITATTEEGGLGIILSSGRYDEISILKVLIENNAEPLRDAFINNFKTFVETVKNAEGAGIYSAENVTAFVSQLTDAFAKGFPTFDLFGMENFLADIPDIKSLITFPWKRNTLLVLIPLLNFISTFASTKLTKKLTFQPMQQAQQGKGMMLVMEWLTPVMTLWIAFVVPAAIGIYWIFNNLLGMLQQFVLAKAIPLPVFTEEDYKAAERELAGKAPKNRPSSSVEYDSNEKSVFMMDFDDDDESEIPTLSEDELASSEEKKNSPVTQGKMKDSGSDKKNKK